MTLRMGSTLFLVAASFVAAAILFATRPTAAMGALSVTASVTQPMAAAGSDATANQGVARASMMREDKPVYTAADWADAMSACTKLAALCTTAAPKIGVVRKLHYCANCTNTCAFAYDLSRVLMDRPVHELKRWNIFLARCGLRLKELIPGSQHRARDGTLTT